MRKKHTTLKYKKGDTLVVTKDPRKGNVGFSKGTFVSVVAKDEQAYMCIDEGRNCFWVVEENLKKEVSI